MDLYNIDDVSSDSELQYYYVRNIQGDIIAITDYEGNILVNYVYDCYGNHKVLDKDYNEITDLNNIGYRNPLRYRGYYYDSETNLYYLMSRYYDPLTGRFISIDNVEYLDTDNINGLNLYVYCGNNPINKVDPNGNFAILTALIIGAIIGGTIGFGIAAYKDYSDDGLLFNGSVKWYDYLGATVLGAGIGAAIGAFGVYLINTISTFAASSFTLGTAMSTGGAAVMSGGITITGAQVLKGIAIASLAIVLFAKGFGPRMGHNQYENKQFSQLSRKHHLTKDEQRLLHDYISHENYIYKEIERIIEYLFGK